MKKLLLVAVVLALAGLACAQGGAKVEPAAAPVQEQIIVVVTATPVPTAIPTEIPSGRMFNPGSGWTLYDSNGDGCDGLCRGWNWRDGATFMQVYDDGPVFGIGLNDVPDAEAAGAEIAAVAIDYGVPTSVVTEAANAIDAVIDGQGTQRGSIGRWSWMTDISEDWILVFVFQDNNVNTGYNGPVG